MKIDLWLRDCANPRKYEDVENVFQEGNLLCIDLPERIIKYPLNLVFRVVEYKTY